MVIVCAWCRSATWEKPPVLDRRVTYGICPRCAAEQVAEMERLEREEAAASDDAGRP